MGEDKRQPEFSWLRFLATRLRPLTGRPPALQRWRLRGAGAELPVLGAGLLKLPKSPGSPDKLAL